MIHYPEGATPLDPDELEEMRFKHIKTRAELDHLEQANIESGLIWLNRQKNSDLLTEHFVRMLHKKLFADVWKWAGLFRLTEKNIGIDPAQIPIQLRLLLDDVYYWIENEIFSPIEIALRFHHKLVFIHPFVNGNGRHARIMADALLEKKFKQSPINWAKGYSLQSINERRKEYIQALRCADRNDYSLLLKFASLESR